MATAKRPAIVTVLGVLGMIGGFFNILSGLFILFDQNRVEDLSSLGLNDTGLMWFGGVILVFGLFAVYLASSILSGQNWARVWYAVVGALNIVSGFWLLITHDGEARWSGLVTAVLWFFVLQLLFNDKSDKFFESAE